jgi:hypothetical protein
MCKDCYASPEIVQVFQGFSHAHKNDVAEGALNPGEAVKLLNNFRGVEIAPKSPYPCFTKSAAHCAAGLGREAGRFSACFGCKQNAFHRRAVRQGDAEFYRTVGVLQCFADAGCKKGNFRGEFFAQGRRQVRHKSESGGPFVELRKYLPAPVGFFTKGRGDFFGKAPVE